ncbi:DUF805 domain-containing protein [Anaerobiospirillum thomasii]|uniref:DUF805 domain-containing protein n=1 Tax=Anaerobiospirillum thomasii TaxID=179995 RepID=UPI000DE59B94|nr:DUF805 domain-containing protein [Anaerobiospirillum thomasii]
MVQFLKEFEQVIHTCLWHKYASFQGRADPKEFWLFILFLLLVNLAAGVFISLIYLFSMSIAVILPAAGLIVGGILMLVAVLALFALFIPFLAVTARRLHDRDMSAWWLLLMLIPSFGVLALFIICIFEGTYGANRFGDTENITEL